MSVVQNKKFSKTFMLVLGILATDNNLWVALALAVFGGLVLLWFVLSTRAKERAGRT